MNQSRIGSLIEAAANIVIGFTINWCANMLILPMYGYAVSGKTAFSIGCVFTVISLVRQYVLRRWFNQRLRIGALRLAEKVTQ